MDVQAIIVLVVLAVTIGLFVSDRLPLDLVALMALCTLLVTGVLSPSEALAGFANPIVPMIAGLFVVGAGLQVTGVTGWLGRQLARVATGGETRLILVLMVTAAVLSSFMSSTGTVAVLMPVAITLAKRSRTSPSRVLLPLAFASLLGGTLTLVGTPPNIVVADTLQQNGETPFGFFTYTAPGLVLLVLGMGYMLVVGRKLLPKSEAAEDEEAGPASLTQPELAAAYAVDDRLATARVPESSPLVGVTLGEANLRRRYGVNVIGWRRGPEEEDKAVRCVPTGEIHAGDRLRLQVLDGSLDTLIEEQSLERLTDTGDVMLPPQETMAELVVPRRSSFTGRTVRSIGFRTRFRSTVLAVQRRGETLAGDVSGVELRPGDTLLVKGAVKNIDMLAKRTRDFVVIAQTTSRDAAPIDVRGATVAVVSTAAMLILMGFQLVPNVLAVLLAALALALFRVVTTGQAYQRINWESVIVIAAVLPLSTALDKTGLMARLVDLLESSLGNAGPLTALGTLFVVTSIASQVMSNTATTVLVAPVAYQLAIALGVSPRTFLMTVAIAASTAFATPIASPVNMLVLNAGGYRFKDFFRLGFPLQLILLVATLLVVPLLFPL